MTRWLLGTHLDCTADDLDDHEGILLVESTAFADRRPSHPHKLTQIFAAGAMVSLIVSEVILEALETGAELAHGGYRYLLAGLGAGGLVMVLLLYGVTGRTTASVAGR